MIKRKSWLQNHSGILFTGKLKNNWEYILIENTQTMKAVLIKQWEAHFLMVIYLKSTVNINYSKTICCNNKQD